MFSGLDIFSATTRSCLFISISYKTYRIYPVLDIFFLKKLDPDFFSGKIFLPSPLKSNGCIPTVRQTDQSLQIFSFLGKCEGLLSCEKY